VANTKQAKVLINTFLNILPPNPKLPLINLLNYCQVFTVSCQPSLRNRGMDIDGQWTEQYLDNW
jgi:hypothetical protein